MYIRIIDILDLGKFMTGQILKACHRLLSRKYKVCGLHPITTVNSRVYYTDSL